MAICLTLAGIALLSADLTEASEAPEGWMMPYIIVLLMLGVLTLIGFVF